MEPRGQELEVLVQYSETLMLNVGQQAVHHVVDGVLERQRHGRVL